jgi:hypothetical protein
VTFKTVNLTVEVHFEKPTGFQYDTIYRIYVNEELLVERSWIWDSQTFLKENICINVNSDTVYTIFLDSILSIPHSPIKLPGFRLENLQSNDERINIVDCDPQLITFRII